MATLLGNKQKKSEYIEDSAIKEIELDEFGHSDFVEELTELIKDVKPRTNIAVFAPWGSGKSSLAELLGNEFEKRPDGIWFTTFDAFKFAQDSLSRHFITRLAKNFEVDDEKLKAKLYSKTNTKEFEITESDKRDLKTKLLRFSLGIGIALLLLSVAFAHFDDSNSRSWPDYLIAMLPTWAVLTAVATLLWKFIEMKYSYDVSTEEISGEEQFVDQFQTVIDTVKGRGADKIVVFIDELDRCSDKEVVTTLETLKTFLDVDPCIFVVAADRQVLDKALQHEARQATPENVENPYYSAGSAYLDKIFQHQLELPPFASPSMPDFAMKLVSGRPGIWSQMNGDDLKYFFSVLIPSHVTNPRRVKVLLNSFVTTYHLMKRRVERGDLENTSEDEIILGDRLNEIAKLVCLRCEFPNFAAHLSSEDRLPELILNCIGVKELAYEVDDQAIVLARRFVDSEIHVADLLEEGHLRLVDRESADSTDNKPDNEEDPEDGDVGPSETGATPAESSGSNKQSAVASAHFQQLTRYLQKTDRIAGPRSDLIYLASESKGLAISETDARLLGRAARDRAFSAAIEVLERLEEPAQLDDALSYLATVANTRFGEIEGDNAVLCLFEIADRDFDISATTANELLDSIGRYSTKIDELLDDANLAGVLKLARRGNRTNARDLREDVALRPGASGDGPTGRELIRDFAVLSEDARPAAVGSFVSMARRNGGAASLADLTLELPDQGVADLFELIAPVQGNFLAVSVADEDDEEEASRVRREAEKSREVVTALVRGAMEADRIGLVENLIATSLRPSDRQLRDELFELIPNGEIHFEPLAIAIATEVSRFDTEEVAPWLNSIDERDVSDREGLAQRLSEALANAVEEFVVGEIDIEELEERNGPLVGLTEQLQESVSQEPLQEKIQNLLEVIDLASAQGVTQRARTREAAEHLSKQGLLDSEWSGTVLIDSGAGALTDSGSAPVIAELNNELTALLRGVGRHANIESLASLRGAFQDHELLSVDDSETGEIRCVGAIREVDPEIKHRFTPAHMRDAYSARGPAFAHGMAIWIRDVSKTAAGVWIAVEPRSSEELPTAIHRMIDDRAHGMNANERAELNRGAAEKYVTEPVDHSFFDAAMLSSAHENVISAAFLGAFPDQPTIDNWRNGFAFLALWHPSSAGTQDKVVSRFLLRTINSGPTGADLALDHIDSFAHFVGGVRESVSDALSTHISEHNRDRLKSELERIGWLKKKSKFPNPFK